MVLSAIHVHLQGLRGFLSCIGLVGNVFLIISIFQIKFSRVKSFEVFLLGLAAANLEEILVVNIYDIVILRSSLFNTGTMLCHSFKFFTIFGESGSILFTVLISIFRYQKLRDASKRVNLPIYLDNIRAAWMVSGLCVLLSFLISVPVFIVNLQGTSGNTTTNTTTIGTSCAPDFFLCSRNDCPTLNKTYKFLFISLYNLLPLIIVTISSCLIITVLLNQRKTVASGVSMSESSTSGRKSRGPRLQRSTIAVLGAMGLFQVDWTVYLILLLTVSPDDFPFWTEIEFFISTSYTSISPYVYGIGNNLFSVRSCKNK